MTMTTDRARMAFGYEPFGSPPLLTMYDSASANGIPPNARFIAAYLDGGDYDTVKIRFPRAKLLGIATHAQIDGDCLDVESGDAGPGVALGWVERQLSRGAYRPCVYASVAVYMPEVQRALEHLTRSHYRLWVAHWTDTVKPDRVPTGYDALQWLNTSAYDESLCLPDFFGEPSPRTPTLNELQREELEAMHAHLPNIIGEHDALTNQELGQLKVMQAHLAGITKGY